MKSDELKKKGISLRSVYFWLIVITIIVFGLSMFSIYMLPRTFFNMKDANSEHLELDKAAHELMDASDFLTENVQRFTLNGNVTYMNNYFKEAFENNHREKAISKMSSDPKCNAAKSQLVKAMKASQKLMNQEYYAMRLVVEAKNITDYPQQIMNVQLDSNDLKLSADEKMRKATSLVLNEDYYNQKEVIRKNMHESLDEIEKISMNYESTSLQALNNQLVIVCVMSIIQTVVILFMVILTSRLGIKPVLEAVEKIKTDDPIPEIGANEFRYLAHTYNKMYAIYKTSLDRLNFKASHDELTGAYNRSGYELLLSSVDMSSTHLILFDLDNFKSINDNFGHETGDLILKKLVTTLKNNFRSDDYICRIGGDEFVVFMVHSGEAQKQLIAAKLEHINSELADEKDGLPSISVSVGIVHGTDSQDGTGSIFEKADEAMYRSKKSGKSTYTFYAG